ncbi:uncharacterized protein FIBRA_07027 [Fibroporia radiculosa]|uniref:Uncharacterized protein n=1 Tax=Fibroporia radiculosa TaxID=599839 RepID=J4H4E1_9APHY|nr:uncharacterized protein FIBRA_07027 [Fibroporia radiculosa]CCM04834.1 predicted protein [Fibroporia radiculosa]
MFSPMNGRMSPTSSPTRTRVAPPGFLVPPKPNGATPIARMSVRELRDQRARNARILSQSTASTSSYAQRIAAEQAAIESRLLELVEVDAIQRRLGDAQIHDADEPMSVDPPQQPEYHPIDTKRRVLAKFASHMASLHPHSTGMTLQEAVRIEQEAHAADQRRKQELEEKRRRQGYIANGEILTKEEREARMWAFMNYKPTDSDLEDDEDDEDDDDPSTWFEDDQDDGRKGQDIVEPDEEDFSNIIRIDESRIPFSIPRED